MTKSISDSYKNNKPTKIEYFFVFLLIIFSGNPAITANPNLDVLQIIFATFMSIYSLFKCEKFLTTDFYKICLIFGGIIVIQTIDFYFFPFRTISGFYVRLFLGFIVMNSVKEFPYIFIRIFYWLSITALLFHIVRFIGMDIISALKPLDNLFGAFTQGRQNAFFHTFFISVDINRNAGMFWEPGAFAGYLNLSILLLGIIKHKLSKRIATKYLIVLTIALLSTMSTMGYLAYIFSMIFYFISDKESKKFISLKSVTTVIVIILILLTSFFVFDKIDFLKEKIVNQIYQAETRSKGWEINRFGTLIFDLKYIKEKPLFGWGANSATRFSLDPNAEDIGNGMGNGMSDFIVKYGLIGFLTFIVTLFCRLKNNNISTLNSSLFLLVIVITLQGECFLMFPLFVSLMFLNEGITNNIIIRKISW